MRKMEAAQAEARAAGLASRESDARARAVLESATEGILAVDRSGRIQVVNAVLAAMFGYSREELLGSPLDKLIPTRFHDVHGQYQEAYFQRPTRHPMGSRMAQYGRSKDGREFPVEIGLGHFEVPSGSYAIAFVRDVTQKMRAERTIKQSRDEIRDLAARLMTAPEEERRRIARELHDGLVQDLAALRIDLSVLGETPAVAQAGVADEIRQAATRVQRLAESARAISHQLHPAALEQLGLVPALRAHAADVRRMTGVEVQIEALGAIPRAPLPVELGLYRIAQEAVWNAARHSGAHNVQVALRATADRLALEVIDQGEGFSVREARASRAIGLVGMEERARLIGAHFEIVSQTGQGTIVRIAIAVG